MNERMYQIDGQQRQDYFVKIVDSTQRRIKMNDKTNLEVFTAACIEAMYFSETGDTDQPESNAEMDIECRLNLEADCRSWWRQYGCYVVADACICKRGEDKAAHAGHDFWMTRNHHGVGFWDGDWEGPYVAMLSQGCEKYGVFNIYKGDDGKIYY